jgi:hypothetical protein
MTTAAPDRALHRLDWSALQEQLDADGVATTAPLLSPQQCSSVVAMFDEDERFRSTVVMARHAFGEGSYRYFADPLPPLAQTLREQLYPPLATIANRWAERLGERTFPTTLDDLLAECAALGQHRPTPLVLRYGPGGYNCLHQDVYGDLTFPLQFLVMLSRPDEDFTGGESVFVEQRPQPAVPAGRGASAPGRGRDLPGAEPAETRLTGLPPGADAPRRERRAPWRAARARHHLPQRTVTTDHESSAFISG